MENQENNASEEASVAEGPELPVERQAAGQPTFHLEDIFTKRLIAGFIDGVIIGASATILLLPGMIFLPKTPVNIASVYGFFVFATAAVLMLIKDMPYKFWELENQTPGKKVMNIKVTDLQGNPITAEMSIKRNFLPAVPFIVSAISMLFTVVHIPIITPIIGFVVFLPMSMLAFVAIVFEVYKIYAGERNRRFGDTMAGTIVSWE